jgi:hypothetical protein
MLLVVLTLNPATDLLAETNQIAAATSHLAKAARGIPATGVPSNYPSLASLGPRPSAVTTAPVVYRKVADGDWRIGDTTTRAPFQCANGDRDMIVNPGDHLVFKHVTFANRVNVGPIWNYTNDNAAETDVILEDCFLKGGLNISTVGKMKVTVSHAQIDGMVCLTPGPDSLISLDHVSILAAHGGDAARIGRPKHQTGYPYGQDSKTPVVMQDCLIRTSGPINPGDHRDAMQVFGGAGILFSNVVFNLNYGEFKGLSEGQNSALFIEDGSNGSVADIDIVDCWILGSGSYFHMGIQKKEGTNSKNIHLIRPRIARGTTPLYGSDYGPFRSGLYKVEGPVYSDDLSPMPLSNFGL